MSRACDLSIVVPVYRSADILPRFHAELSSALGGREYELILIHDCGPDNSWEVIKTLAARDPRVRGVNLRRNVGQHNAIMAGLRLARGAVVVTMDDDLQHAPKDIPALYDKVCAGADVCYAVFGKRHHAPWKQLGSAVNDIIASYLLNKPRNLYLSPFRAFSDAVRREIVRYTGPSVYLDGLILGVTRRITTVDVTHRSRAVGEGNYNLRRSLSLFLKMATMTSIAPLRLATAFGFLVAAGGLILAIALLAMRLMGYGVPIGWTSIVVTILVMGGAQLVSIGMIGEYLGKVVLEVRRTPQFVVAETIGFDSVQSIVAESPVGGIGNAP